LSKSVLRLLAVPLIATWLVVAVTGCGSKPEANNANTPQIKALRFAGVDLEYALERIAAEADMPLALDQIRPEDGTPDLFLYRVDVDLPAGPVDVALRKLRESAGGIDFEIVDGVIYIRSNQLIRTKTPIDLPLLPAKSFKGTLKDLVGYIEVTIPTSYIALGRAVGDPEPPEVEFEIADKSSVRDALLQYARTSKVSWKMSRAGQVVNDPKEGVAIVGTSVQLRNARKSTSRRPQIFNPMSTIGALASASARLEVPMLVLDRSIFMNTRGFLNISMQREQKLPLKETIDDLAASGWGPEKWHFKWKMDGDVPVIESRDYLDRLAGRDLLRAELLAGEFEGSLGEFTRWINSHMKTRTTDVLMGGEIVEGQKRGKISIAPGTTLQQALVDFAKSSGVSPYVLLLGSTNPISGKLLTHPNAWQGAYVQDLSEWIPTEWELKRATGVFLDE